MVDVDQLIRYRERQSRRAAVDLGEDFGSVTALDQVLQSVSEYDGAKGSHFSQV